VVLEDTLPRVLVMDLMHSDMSPGLWGDGAITTEVLEKALKLTKTINHVVAETGMHALFNSSSHIGRKITKPRVDKQILKIVIA
jgi:hypothetical protein